MWIATLPDPVTTTAGGSIDEAQLTSAEQLAGYLNPYFVSLNALQNQVVLLLIVTALLAAAVWRSRRLLLRQVAAESGRANLARYFSPNIVDQLATADAPLDAVRTQSVAILFADIVGFSTLSEDLPPDRVIALLRSFHQRMCRVVFAHDGTVDKYIGDAVMATFGTPTPGRSDATRALACTQAMLGEVERWNAKRSLRRAAPVAIGIGLHVGSVVVGNIGDERRLEFTVIGDAVNLASRLERLTRQLGVAVAASDDFIEATRREGVAADRLAAFRREGGTTIRGRRNPIAIWTCGPAIAEQPPRSDQGSLAQPIKDCAVDGDITGRDGAKVRTQVRMQRRQGVERHRGEGMMLGVVRHVPGEVTDRRIAQRRARVGEHVRHERAAGVLCEQIESQQRLAGESRNDPVDERDGGCRQDRSEEDRRVETEQQARLGDNARRVTPGDERLGRAAESVGGDGGGLGAPVIPAGDMHQPGAQHCRLGRGEFRILRRILGEAVMGEVEQAEILGRQQYDGAADPGDGIVEPAAAEGGAMDGLVQRREQKGQDGAVQDRRRHDPSAAETRRQQ